MSSSSSISIEKRGAPCYACLLAPTDSPAASEVTSLMLVKFHPTVSTLSMTCSAAQ